MGEGPASSFVFRCLAVILRSAATKDSRPAPFAASTPPRGNPFRGSELQFRQKRTGAQRLPLAVNFPRLRLPPKRFSFAFRRHPEEKNGSPSLVFQAMNPSSPSRVPDPSVSRVGLLTATGAGHRGCLAFRCHPDRAKRRGISLNLRFNHQSGGGSIHTIRG
jgi:hypothetical protein